MPDQSDTNELATTEAAIKPYVDGLVAELEKLGLQVTMRLPTLKVRNPAVAGTDALGILISPGMTQEVRILDQDGRGFGWYWIWPGLRPGERGAPEPEPEIDFLCGADEITFAAGRIGKVVCGHACEDLTSNATPGRAE